MAKQPKVDQSGFQLNKTDLLKDVPLLLKGPAGQLIDYMNSADWTNDGKADLCQIAPYVFKALPLIQAVLPYVQVEKFVDWFVNHDFITDKAKAKVEIVKLLQLVMAAKETVTPAVPVKK